MSQTKQRDSSMQIRCRPECGALRTSYSRWERYRFSLSFFSFFSFFYRHKKKGFNSALALLGKLKPIISYNQFLTSTLLEEGQATSSWSILWESDSSYSWKLMSVVRPHVCDKFWSNQGKVSELKWRSNGEKRDCIHELAQPGFSRRFLSD